MRKTSCVPVSLLKVLRVVLLCCAFLSAASAIISAVVLALGFGVYDFWIVYPPSVKGYRWWIPLSLFIVCACSLYLSLLLGRSSFNDKFGYGKCHKCGYDLRATRDRCPECGTKPEYLNRNIL